MNSYGFFRAMRALLFFGLFCLFGIVMILRFVIEEFRLELGYRQQYGDNWRTEFENIHGAGSLSHAHLQMAIAIGALTAICGILAWFYWKNIPQTSRRGSSRSTRRR